MMKKMTDNQIRKEIRKKIRYLLDNGQDTKRIRRSIMEFFISSGHDTSKVKTIYNQVIDEIAEEKAGIFSI